MAGLEATYYFILTSLKEKIRNARIKAAVLSILNYSPSIGK